MLPLDLWLDPCERMLTSTSFLEERAWYERRWS